MSAPAVSLVRRSVLAAWLTILVTAGSVLPAAAVVDDGPPPEPEGGISEADLLASVRQFNPAGSVRTFSIDGAVRSLGDDVRSDGDQTVISLSTDLLFGPNSWDLPAAAPGRIAELVAQVPQGATVRVTGHTDSVPTGVEFDNQELSEHRARAVAEALADERPDLDLDVSGVGDSDPAVTENEDDPDTFAANRRVEIAYAG